MKIADGMIGLCLLVIISSGKLNGQATIDGEFRPRAEFRQGFRRPLADSLNPALLVLQRTRFNANYTTRFLMARLSLQDSRIWGQSNTKTSGSEIKIYEAWTELLLASGFSVRFGRQALKYDDQRIFGAAAWSNTGLAHDVLLLKWKPGNSWQLHAGFAYNNTSDTLMEMKYSVSKMYKAMGFFWVSKRVADGMNVSAIAVEEGLPQPGAYTSLHSRFTLGTNIGYSDDSSRFSFSAAGYYQTGKDFSANGLEAYLVSFKAGYRVYMKNTLFIGTDYFSGTKSDAGTGTSSTFNKLYGANHSFTGNMEYWVTLPQSGLVDSYCRLCSTFSKRFGAEVTCHTFYLAQDCVVNNQKINRNMGSELDLVVSFAMSSAVNLQSGYSMYFKSESTKTYFKMNGAETCQPVWAYLMLTVNPVFYKSPAN